MDNSTNQAAWYSYFAENMQQLGIPVPATWPGGSSGVPTAIASLVAMLDKTSGQSLGTQQLTAANIDPALLRIIGRVHLGYFVSGALGSAAVAARRCWACGTQLMDVISYAQQNAMWSTSVGALLTIHPEIYDRSRPNREIYGRIAKAKA